jgi:DNA polymerase I-like protein with 3'-5' exonuclease and polymerase domains
VNLQAIPHDYQLPELAARFPTPRQLFVPRPGTKLWELDLSQAELRVAAVEANCVPMLDMITNGEDIHGNVARQLFRDEPGSDTWFENRQIGKRADFSLIFGVGADTFQSTLAKQTYIWRPINEINSIVRRWRGLYPEFGRAIRVYMDRADHWGYVRLVNGRVRFFAGYEDKHKAFNGYVQGSLAELMKQWTLEVDLLWPEMLLLAIHDSLVLEVPIGEEDLVYQARDIGAGIGTDMFNVEMTVDVSEWGKKK